MCVCGGGGGGLVRWDPFGGGLVQVGAGLRLVQVGDGGCKGPKGGKGQTLEGIETGRVERIKIQLLSSIKKKLNYQNFYLIKIIQL